jgi:gamma-glutamyl-gamma-aminobutyrate hydrolase PuuD
MAGVRKVYIVGQAFASLFQSMFRNKGGWQIVNTPEAAEFLQFTGGADISPSLYKDAEHPTTHASPKRDEYEVDMYQAWVGKKKMLGVCRGHQLFAALNGCKLYQDVDGHASGNHLVIDVETEEKHIVSSVHHQMVRNTTAGVDGRIVALANVSHRKRFMLNGQEMTHGVGFGDIEAMYWASTQSLGVQFHPEFGPTSCTNYYFQLIDRYFPQQETVNDDSSQTA